MTATIAVLSVAAILLWYTIRGNFEKKDRNAGIVISLIAILFFFFYAFGIIGIGLSSFILDWLGKAGLPL